MPRYVVLIDPFAKKVENVALDEGGHGLLNQIRDLIGCEHLTTEPMQPGITMWSDNLGMLKGAKQRFWRPRDTTRYIAGRAVLTGVDQDGMPIPLRLDTAQVEASIDWSENARIERIVENLRALRHPELGPWPVIDREIIWAQDPPTIEEVPDYEEQPLVEREADRKVWVVYEDDEKDDFVCRERLITGDGEAAFTGEERRFEALGDVIAFAKELDMHFEMRSPVDDPSLAGTII